MSTTSSGERKPLSSFHPVYLFQTSKRAFQPNDSLTTHSAEVNIGIIAACLPTLLPLYRLIHDKLTSTTGRFYVHHGKFLFGQRPNADNPLQQATHDPPRTESEIALPQNAQRVNSARGIFTMTGEAEDKDIEMKTAFSGRPSHFQYA